MKAYTWRRVPTSCCRCSLPTVPAPSNSRRATRDARRLVYNVRRTSTNVQNAVPRSTARRRTITCGMQSADGAPPNTTATRPKIHPRQSVTQQRLAGLAVLTHEYSRTSVHARVFTHEHSHTSTHARVFTHELRSGPTGPYRIGLVCSAVAHAAVVVPSFRCRP